MRGGSAPSLSGLRSNPAGIAAKQMIGKRVLETVEKTALLEWLRQQDGSCFGASHNVVRPRLRLGWGIEAMFSDYENSRLQSPPPRGQA